MTFKDPLGHSLFLYPTCLLSCATAENVLGGGCSIHLTQLIINDSNDKSNPEHYPYADYPSHQDNDNDDDNDILTHFNLNDQQ